MSRLRNHESNKINSVSWNAAACEKNLFILFLAFILLLRKDETASFLIYKPKRTQTQRAEITFSAPPIWTSSPNKKKYLALSYSLKRFHSSWFVDSWAISQKYFARSRISAHLQINQIFHPIRYYPFYFFFVATKTHFETLENCGSVGYPKQDMRWKQMRLTVVCTSPS